MKRFLVFPIFSALMGILVFSLSYYLGTAIIFQQSSLDLFLFMMSITVTHTLFYALFLGALIGLSLATWDLLRNRHDQSSTQRLIANSLCCMGYAFLFMLTNAAFYTAATRLQPNIINVNSWIASSLVFSLLFINFTAILWAVIRSITTGDVLTPHVLLRKLRQRTRLE